MKSGHFTMRILLTLGLSLVLIGSFGCEGESRKRTTTSSNVADPSAAKRVEISEKEKQIIVNDAPAPSKPTSANTASNPTNVASNPTVAQPANNQANKTPAKVDITKLDEVRKRLNYHSAILLRKEVDVVANATVWDDVNLVYRTKQGLDFKLLQKGMSDYTALNNFKPPKDAAEFIKFLEEFNIGLPELGPNSFYIYDPELAALEKSKTELDYLKIYEK